MEEVKEKEKKENSKSHRSILYRDDDIIIHLHNFDDASSNCAAGALLLTGKILVPGTCGGCIIA